MAQLQGYFLMNKNNHVAAQQHIESLLRSSYFNTPNPEIPQTQHTSRTSTLSTDASPNTTISHHNHNSASAAQSTGNSVLQQIDQHTATTTTSSSLSPISSDRQTAEAESISPPESAKVAIKPRTRRPLTALELDKMPFNPQYDWEKDVVGSDGRKSMGNQ
jgi:hypothetical protein